MKNPIIQNEFMVQYIQYVIFNVRNFEKVQYKISKIQKGAVTNGFNK